MKILPILIALILFLSEVIGDCNIANENKIDCVAGQKNWTVAECLAKSCCHKDDPGFPSCYHSYGKVLEAKCEVSATFRQECGDIHSTESSCHASNCCWQITPGSPTCFHSKSTSLPKVYIHMMPWFETKATNDGHWGQHWTMNGANPDQMVGDRRKICSKYYPLIDLYASGDSHVIDWQLGLMKLSGVTGILIDWYGTANVYNYLKHRTNTEAIIKGCERVGLQFAIVYEDQTLPHVLEQGKTSDVLAQGRADMIYLRDHYFTNKNYIHIDGAPLLLNFGPEFLKSGSQWSDIFSVFKQKPVFLPLWNHKYDLGSTASGEFAWIWSNYLEGLNNFYKYRNLKIKFGAAYPGFDTYPVGHQQNWSIPVSVNTFEKTLDLAINFGINYIQVATWNDYGEGTMIEPTKEFGYSFLTSLQKKLGVKHTQADLEQVTKLFHQRVFYENNATRLAQLEQAFYSLVDFKLREATQILDSK